MTDPLRILLARDNSAEIYLFLKALLGAELIFELTVIEDITASATSVLQADQAASTPKMFQSGWVRSRSN